MLSVIIRHTLKDSEPKLIVSFKALEDYIAATLFEEYGADSFSSTTDLVDGELVIFCYTSSIVVIFKVRTVE